MRESVCVRAASPCASCALLAASQAAGSGATQFREAESQIPSPYPVECPPCGKKTGGPEARPSASSIQEFVDYFRLRINISPPKARASKEIVAGSGTTVIEPMFALAAPLPPSPISRPTQ